jgi:hypothetical protein
VTAGERLAGYGLALPPGYALVSLAERPDLDAAHQDLNVAAWPEFMLHDPVVHAHFGSLFTDFLPWQCSLLDPVGEVIAGLNCAPLRWDGTADGLPEGWDDQLLRTVADLRSGAYANTLGALQVVVRRDRRGSGHAGLMIGAMRALAAEQGLPALIACVRPTGKDRYPLIPIERYAAWTREDGLPFDPWIRLHVRLGGRIVRAEPASMRMEGTVAEWQAWTGLSMRDSGSYLPEGAAAPVEIDVEAGRGVYLDPNVWIVHRVD